jgi:mRNA interferase MazF
VNGPDEGYIAYVNLDPLVGREQSGNRPCLILTAEGYHNKTPYMVICPITTNMAPYAFKVALPDGLPIKGAILVDQIESVDRHVRGCRIVGKLPDEVMAHVRGRLAALLGLNRV